MLSVKAKFYEVLYAGADNPTLWEQARVLNHRLARLRVRSLSKGGRPEESIREIEDMFRFIERRQPELAVAAWRDHIRNAAQAATANDINVEPRVDAKFSARPVGNRAGNRVGNGAARKPAPLAAARAR